MTPTELTEIPPSVTADSQVNVRSGPSTSTAIKGHLLLGETAPIESKKTCNSYTWWEISHNDLTGWVREDVVTEQGNTENVPDNTTVECPPEPIPCGVPPLSAWTLAPGFTAGRGVSYGSCAGRSGLLVSTVFQGNGVKEHAAVVGSMLNNNKGTDWTACNTITANVYVPPEFQFARARLAIQTGPGYSWFEMPLSFVNVGQWTQLTGTLRAMTSSQPGLSPDLTDVRRVFVEFFNDQSPLRPDQYLCVSSVLVY